MQASLHHHMSDTVVAYYNWFEQKKMKVIEETQGVNRWQMRMVCLFCEYIWKRLNTKST
jgi:hypothetical protein